MVTQAEEVRIKVADAGSELLFNRRKRDRWSGKNTVGQASESEISSVDIASKAALWPRPNYHRMIEDGLSVRRARIFRNVYERVKSRPKWGFQSLSYIEDVKTLRQRMQAWAQASCGLPDQPTWSVDGFGAPLTTIAGAVNALQAEGALAVEGIEQGKAQQIECQGKLGWWADERWCRSKDLAGMCTHAALSEIWKRPKRQIRGIWEREDEVAVLASWPNHRPLWHIRGIRVIDSQKHEVAFNEIKTAAEGVKPWYAQIANGTVSFAYANTRQECVDLVKATGRWLVMSGGVWGFDTEQEAIDAAAKMAKPMKRAGKCWQPDAITIDQCAPEIVANHPETLATTGSIKAEFGLKGLNFGNWMRKKEKLSHVRTMHRALSDLTQIMGFGDTREVGTGGLLGIAIGAQGSGLKSGAGHYVADYKEINLTRIHGLGVLGHEYGHHLDTMAAACLSARGIPTNGFMSAIEINVKGIPKEGDEEAVADLLAMSEAMKDVMHALRWKQVDIQAHHDRIRRQWDEGRKKVVAATMENFSETSQAAALAIMDRLMSAPTTGECDFVATEDVEARTAQLLDELHALVGQDAAARKKREEAERLERKKDLTDLLLSSAPSEQGLTKLLQLAKWVRSKAPGSAEWNQAPVPVSTQFAQAAHSIDERENRKKPYWSTSHEMFARAFSDWLVLKMKKRECSNEYLSRDWATLYLKGREAGKTADIPHLLEDELAAAEGPMDRFVDFAVKCLRQWRQDKYVAQPETETLH